MCLVQTGGLCPLWADCGQLMMVHLSSAHLRFVLLFSYQICQPHSDSVGFELTVSVSMMLRHSQAVSLSLSQSWHVIFCATVTPSLTLLFCIRYLIWVALSHNNPFRDLLRQSSPNLTLACFFQMCFVADRGTIDSFLLHPSNSITC